MAARTYNDTCIIIKRISEPISIDYQKQVLIRVHLYTKTSDVSCMLKKNLKVKYFFRSFYEFQRHNNYWNLLFLAINLWTAAKVHMLICKGI